MGDDSGRLTAKAPRAPSQKKIDKISSELGDLGVLAVNFSSQALPR
jgi:hypothetical protein